MSDKLFSTTIYFNVVLSGDKYAAQTCISADTAEEYQNTLSDLFSTMAAKVDSKGEALFVTFEPRAVAGAPVTKEPGKPLADAVDQPNCPFHGVPIKVKHGRNGDFYSCSERKADNSYCNWKPADKK